MYNNNIKVTNTDRFDIKRTITQPPEQGGKARDFYWRLYTGRYYKFWINSADLIGCTGETDSNVEYADFAVQQVECEFAYPFRLLRIDYIHKSTNSFGSGYADYDRDQWVYADYYPHGMNLENSETIKLHENIVIPFKQLSIEYKEGLEYDAGVFTFNYYAATAVPLSIVIWVQRVE